MTVPNIIGRAEALGYKQLGIVDHVYAESGIEPIKENCRLIAQARSPVQVFGGAELDFPEAGKPTIPVEQLAFLDYRFAAINHSYLKKRFNDFKEASDIKAAVDYWLDLAEGVLDFPINGIVHPFEPLDKYVDGAPAFYFLYKKRKARYMKLLRNLAKKGVALELRSDCDWFQTAAIAMRDFYRLAITSGVKLSMATDAHWLDRMGYQLLDARCARDIDLKPENIWHPSSPPRNQVVSAKKSASKAAARKPKPARKKTR